MYLLIGSNDTNIMSEQLSKDTAKMHRLELENQRLKSEVDDLKMNGFKEQKVLYITSPLPLLRVYYK